MLSIFQGMSQDLGCQNVTTGNITTLKRLPIQPNFSVSIFFLLLTILLCCCIAAFSLIHFSPLGIRHRKDSSDEESNDSSNSSEQDSTEKIIGSKRKKAKNWFKLNCIFSKEEYILFSIVTVVTFFCYGVLPGIQSYSTLPYGNTFSTSPVLK